MEAEYPCSGYEDCTSPIEAFAHRWGELELEAFTYTLHEGEDEDKVIMPWRLEPGRGKKISNPTWEQIYEALLEMDGTHSNEVELELEDVGSMLINGGDQGRYLVVYFPAEDPNTLAVTLTDLTLTGPDVQLTVQTPAEYPARVAVRLPLVLQAVEQFYRSGELPTEVYWEPS